MLVMHSSKVLRMKKAVPIVLLLLSLTASAFIQRPFSTHSRACLSVGTQWQILHSTQSDNDDSTSSFSQSLSDRIAQVEQNESTLIAGLQKRAKAVAKADAEFNRNNGVVELPVICLDALLPNQRLEGSTSDPTFCNLLRSIGLGGSFVMTSLNNRQRKIRRFGVIARIELVDVDNNEDPNDLGKGVGIGAQYDNHLSTPTAVAFSIVGKKRCEILGSSNTDMKLRIGRWRRGYDPDGEESRLGWGDERFVDKADGGDTPFIEVDSKSASRISSDDAQWNTNNILIIDEAYEDAQASSEAIAKATYLIPLIERWISLASDQTTFDNVDVVARTRRKSGEPGLSINASALIQKVQLEIGPMPSPTCPNAFAVWGAALINPLPPLGVSTEIRGAVLEAPGAERKLAVLERGLIKSIDNLDGTRPLNM